MPRPSVRHALIVLSLLSPAIAAAQSESEPVNSGHELPKDGALPAGGDTASNSPVLATVNGSPITQASVDAVSSQIQAQGQNAEPERILDELINLELLTQQAEVMKLGDDPAIKAALELQYTQTMANAWLARISDDIEVSEQELREEYNAQTANLAGSEYRASHILLETEKEAAAVIAALEDGEDFSALAKEKSVDPAGENGGDLGWLQPGAMVPQFSAAVETMDVGDTSAEPVQSDFGFHVIKLVDRRDSALPDYEAVKPGLRNLALRNKLAERVDALREEADIQRQ